MILLLLLAAAVAGPLVEWDLETDDGGFTVSGDTEQWTWGEVTNGPASGFDGANAWAVGLTADYLNDAVDYLEVPVPDLSGADYPVLSFTHWHDLDVGDHGWIEADSGNGWAVVTPLYGYPTTTGWTGSSHGWEPVGVDLSAFGDAPRLRFVFSADPSSVADGWYIDNVGIFDGDITPPRVLSVSGPTDTEDLTGPYPVNVEADDDVGVTAMSLVWSADGGAEQTVWMTEGEGAWSGAIPGQEPDTVVSFHVLATDGANASRSPADGTLDFRVYLPAPQSLVGPEGRVIDDVATVTWSPPVSVHPVTSYRVYRDGVAVAETADTAAEVPLVDGVNRCEVRAVFDVGEGDPSNEIVIDSSVPTVRALEPAFAYAGETVRVELLGAYLFLVDGEVSADFGAGVYTRDIEVLDVDRAILTLEVADDAEAGTPRDVVIGGPLGETVAPEAFLVASADDAPRLVEVAPTEVYQGDVVEITVTWVGALGGTPEVDFGDGAVVESVEVVDATHAIALVAIAPNAPLGDHAVTLDDGRRIFEGVSLEVKDVLITTGGPCGCASGAGAGSLAAVLVGVLAALRRRG